MRACCRKVRINKFSTKYGWNVTKNTIFGATILFMYNCTVMSKKGETLTIVILLAISVFLIEMPCYLHYEWINIEVQDRYRPWQPNWEYTMWKFHQFSTTQILRENNFGHFEASKTAILTILVVLNFEFMGLFDFYQVWNFQNRKFKTCPLHYC